MDSVNFESNQCCNVTDVSVDAEGSKKLPSPCVASQRGVLWLSLCLAIIMTSLLIFFLASMPTNMLLIIFFCGASIPLTICCIVAFGRYIKGLIEQRRKHSLGKKDEQTCNHGKEFLQYRKNLVQYHQKNFVQSHENILENCHKDCEIDATSLGSEKKNDRKISAAGADCFVTILAGPGMICFFDGSRSCMVC